MAETHTARRGSRREALVAAALDCLVEKGFEGLRLREVASRVGIDHSTLHHHFATKRALIDAVMEHAVRQFRPTMPREGAPEKRLRAHLQALAHLIREQPALFAVMGELDQRALHDQVVRAVLAKHEQGWRSALTGVFEQGTWSADLDPEIAVELVIATIKGVSRNPRSAAAAIGQLEALLTARRPDGDCERRL